MADDMDETQQMPVFDDTGADEAREAEERAAEMARQREEDDARARDEEAVVGARQARQRQRMERSVSNDADARMARGEVRRARADLKAYRSTMGMRAFGELYSNGISAESISYLVGLVSMSCIVKIFGYDPTRDSTAAHRLGMPHRKHLSRDFTSRAKKSVDEGISRGHMTPGPDIRDALGVAGITAAEAQARAAAAPISDAARTEAASVMSGATRPGRAATEDTAEDLCNRLRTSWDNVRAGRTTPAEARAAWKSATAGYGQTTFDLVRDVATRRILAGESVGYLAKSSDPLVVTMADASPHQGFDVRETPGGLTVGLALDGEHGLARERIDGTKAPFTDRFEPRRPVDQKRLSRGFKNLVCAYTYGSATYDHDDLPETVRDIVQDMGRPISERRLFVGNEQELSATRQRVYSKYGPRDSALVDAILVAGYEHPELLGPSSEASAERDETFGRDLMHQLDLMGEAHADPSSTMMAQRGRLANAISSDLAALDGSASDADGIIDSLEHPGEGPYPTLAHDIRETLPDADDESLVAMVAKELGKMSETDQERFEPAVRACVLGHDEAQAAQGRDEAQATRALADAPEVVPEDDGPEDSL